jgi:formylglycine-generating enzyme required for sulfatase activity/predicted esterase
METSTSILEKFKQNKVFKVVSGYAIVALATVQIASLVSDSFGFGEEFMQNIILIFLLILPFIALVAWAASSRFSTAKILSITLAVLFTGYGTGSYVWVNNFALPDLKQKLGEDDYVGAWDNLNSMNSFAPFFYNSDSIDSDISLPVSLNLNEDNVEVYWKPYTAEKDYEWRYIGKTPLPKTRLPRGVIQIKLVKEGFHEKDIVEANPSYTFKNHPIPPIFEISNIEMNKLGTVPDGMIAIDGGRFIPALIGEGVTDYNLSPYFIDKYEVNNEEFKKFIDDGGYEIFQYWKDMEFIKEGESLTWEEAKEFMVDSTGRTGPLSWELGDYKEGQGKLPVTGITWYEAQAFARYKGNILPPMYHWAKAAFPVTEIAAPISPVLLKKSNFSNQSAQEVGNSGIGAYGTYDMAGNVTEWSWNIFGGRGLTLGGSYEDAAYSASLATPAPRFTRSKLIGFRTARLINPRDLNPFGDPINRPAPKPPSFYKPFTDSEFSLYSRNFDVGKKDLNSKVIYIDESHPIWDKERVQIDVGYGNEKMDILIFKPKGSNFNKLDSIILYPGANYYRNPPEIDEVNPGEYGLDFIIKSGRALVWPAYKGSMNRINDMNISFPRTPDHMRMFRQLLSNWTVDTSRAIDYLQSRNEFNPDNIFYVGMSYGGIYTTHVLLFEDRFKAAVLYVGGMTPGIPPMSDGKNHFPRMKLPILMLNGRQDYLVPESAPQSMFSFIGTPEKDKRLVFYDSGHWPLPRNQMIKETLSWLDRYED